jgi:[ribosomal protein S5]-alanine N-acetyltransferase
MAEHGRTVRAVTELRTERLRLNEPRSEDAQFVLELVNEPGWLANIGDRGVRSLDEAGLYIQQRLLKAFWLVARDRSGAPLGICGLVQREGLEHKDIGYAFLERHSGRGYATEAAAAVLKYARETLGLRTILAITTPENLPSQRVLTKIGLQFVDLVNLPGHGRPSALFST